MEPKHNPEGGFTLIEIITSIAVIVLVLIAFIPIFPQTMLWSKTAETELVSGNLLGRVANDVRANTAALSLNTHVAGTERKLTEEDFAFLPAYEQPVDITVAYDEEADMYRAFIEVLNAEGVRQASSYVYITNGGTP